MAHGTMNFSHSPTKFSQPANLTMAPIHNLISVQSTCDLLNHLYLPHYKLPTALLDMHHFICGIRPFVRFVNLILHSPDLPHSAHITSSQTPSSLSPSITPSAFHFRLKTNLFNKSAPL